MIQILSAKEVEVIKYKISDWNNNGVKYSLYGSGKVAADILRIINFLQLDGPAAIIDHLQKESQLFGIPVIPPWEAKETDFDAILIASNTFAGLIYDEIRKYNLHEKAVFRFDHLRKISDSQKAYDKRKIENRLLSIFYNVGVNTGSYAVLGEKNYLVSLLELLNVHSLALPELIISNDFTCNAYEGIPVVKLRSLDTVPAPDVILCQNTSFNIDIKRRPF